MIHPSPTQLSFLSPSSSTSATHYHLSAISKHHPALLCIPCYRFFTAGIPENVEQVSFFTRKVKVKE